MTILSTSNTIAFIPSADLANSKLFYEHNLGLDLHKFDHLALEFKVGETTLRVVKVAHLDPADYTIFGWEVAGINATIKELLDHDIEFQRFDGLDQDELGVCTFPGGGKVAWFKDPDGNTLSITQLAEQS